MSFDFTEYSQSSAFAAVQADRDRKRAERLKETAATGQKIAELIADPKWLTYAHTIAEAKDRERELQHVAEQSLLKQVLTSENYVAAKTAQMYHSGRADGLEFALSIAKELVDKGEDAARKIG